MVSDQVQQWEPAVIDELNVRSIPLPSELILRVIQKESGGKPGVVRPGGHDSGLMQVLPSTLKDFNRRNKTNYTIDDMRGKDDISARKQIRVGTDVLSHYWKRAYRYLTNRGIDPVDIDDLAHIADLFYRAGPGATMSRLDKLQNPTWISIETSYPDWPPMKHPRSVFKTPIQWPVERIEPWLRSSYTAPLKKIPPDAPDPKIGFALGIMILMAAFWMMKGKKK